MDEFTFLYIISAICASRLCGFSCGILESSRSYNSFPSISINVSGFMWSSLIQLDLTLVQGDRNGSIRNRQHDNSQLCQYHLLKMLSFFHWMVLDCLSKIK